MRHRDTTVVVLWSLWWSLWRHYGGIVVTVCHGDATVVPFDHRDDTVVHFKHCYDTVVVM